MNRPPRRDILGVRKRLREEDGMPEEVRGTVPAYSRCQTKAALERAAAEGYNAEVRVDDIRGAGVFDRLSIVGCTVGLNDIPEDWILRVSDENLTWMALVTRKNGKVTGLKTVQVQLPDHVLRRAHRGIVVGRAPDARRAGGRRPGARRDAHDHGVGRTQAGAELTTAPSRSTQRMPVGGCSGSS